MTALINTFATIGMLALLAGAGFLLYYSLRRLIRRAPVNPSTATLEEMATWQPRRDSNDHGDILIGLGGVNEPGQYPDYQAILDYNDGIE